MTTQVIPTTAEARPTAPAPVKKEKRSTGVRLVSGVKGESLRLVAARRKNGTAFTFAVWTRPDAKAKNKSKTTNERGGTEEFASWEAAIKNLETRQAERIKAGWKVPATKAFARKPDAFAATALPAPTKATKK
jgi:hypothetical protein